jgi:hypothetical protein
LRATPELERCGCVTMYMVAEILPKGDRCLSQSSWSIETMVYADHGVSTCCMLTVVGCSVLRARRGLALARRAARPRAGGLRGSLFGVVVVTTIDLRLRHGRWTLRFRLAVKFRCFRRTFPFACTHVLNVFEMVACTHSNTEWDLPTNAYESH